MKAPTWLLVEFGEMERVTATVAPGGDGVTERVPVVDVLDANEFTPEVALLVHEHAPS